MRNRLFIILTFIFAFLLYGQSISFAMENTVDPREAAIDRAIGGMVEGSRPLEPTNYAGKNQARPVPGGNLNPSMDTRVTASASAQSLSNSPAIGVGGNTNVGTEPSGGSTEPAGTGSTSDSIVNVDANLDLGGGEPAVGANLTVDTNADTLLDADTSITTDVASTDITVTETGNVAGQDLNTTVNEAPVDAILDTEVVATDIPTDSEATAGLEADVDPVTADTDVAITDPADGLSTGL